MVKLDKEKLEEKRKNDLKMNPKHITQPSILVKIFTLVPIR